LAYKVFIGLQKSALFEAVKFCKAEGAASRRGGTCREAVSQKGQLRFGFRLVITPIVPNFQMLSINL